MAGRRRYWLGGLAIAAAAAAVSGVVVLARQRARVNFYIAGFGKINPGDSRAQVVALLGAPDMVVRGKEIPFPTFAPAETVEAARYALEYHGPYLHCWMIYFDEDDRVVWRHQYD